VEGEEQFLAHGRSSLYLLIAISSRVLHNVEQNSASERGKRRRFLALVSCGRKLFVDSVTFVLVVKGMEGNVGRDEESRANRCFFSLRSFPLFRHSASSSLRRVGSSFATPAARALRFCDEELCPQAVLVRDLSARQVQQTADEARGGSLDDGRLDRGVADVSA
jgi:hypothetical protein